jgi:hypothetical protein
MGIEGIMEREKQIGIINDKVNNFIKNNLSSIEAVNAKAYYPKMDVKIEDSFVFGSEIKIKTDLIEKKIKGLKLFVITKIENKTHILYEKEITNDSITIDTSKFDLKKINLKEFPLGIAIGKGLIQNKLICFKGGEEPKSIYPITINSNSETMFKLFDKDKLNIKLEKKGKKELKSWDELAKEEYIFKAEVNGLPDKHNFKIKFKVEIRYLSDQNNLIDFINNGVNGWTAKVNNENYILNKEFTIDAKNNLDLVKIKFNKKYTATNTFKKISCDINEVNLYLGDSLEQQFEKSLSDFIEILLSSDSGQEIIKKEEEIIQKLEKLKLECDEIKNDENFENDKGLLEQILQKPKPRFEEVTDILDLINGNKDKKLYGIKPHALELVKKLKHVHKELIEIEKLIDNLEKQFDNQNKIKDQLRKLKVTYLEKLNDYETNIEKEFEKFIKLIEFEAEEIEKDENYEIKLKTVQGTYNNKIEGLFKNLQNQFSGLANGIETILNLMMDIKKETQNKLKVDDVEISHNSSEKQAKNISSSESGVLQEVNLGNSSKSNTSSSSSVVQDGVKMAQKTSSEENQSQSQSHNNRKVNEVLYFNSVGSDGIFHKSQQVYEGDDNWATRAYKITLGAVNLVTFCLDDNPLFQRSFLRQYNQFIEPVTDCLGFNREYNDVTSHGAESIKLIKFGTCIKVENGWKIKNKIQIKLLDASGKIMVHSSDSNSQNNSQQSTFETVLYFGLGLTNDYFEGFNKPKTKIENSHPLKAEINGNSGTITLALDNSVNIKPILFSPSNFKGIFDYLDSVQNGKEANNLEIVSKGKIQFIDGKWKLTEKIKVKLIYS